MPKFRRNWVYNAQIMWAIVKDKKGVLSGPEKLSNTKQSAETISVDQLQVRLHDALEPALIGMALATTDGGRYSLTSLSQVSTSQRAMESFRGRRGMSLGMSAPHSPNRATSLGVNQRASASSSSSMPILVLVAVAR